MRGGSRRPSLRFPSRERQLSNCFPARRRDGAVAGLLDWWEQTSRSRPSPFDDARPATSQVQPANAGDRKAIHDLAAGEGEPLTRDEIVRLNEILLRLSIKIPELNEQNFLNSLHRPDTKRDDPASRGNFQPTNEVAKELSQRLIGLHDHPPQRRGYEYERFLTELFDSYGLTPRRSFKLTGEQIDGSFKLRGETYLVEARWQAGLTGQSDLLTFSGKVAGKATWSRGLFISNTGFSDDGLKAFGSGRRTNIICANGDDLHEIVHNRLSLVEVLEEKVRRAAETNRAFVPVRELR